MRESQPCSCASHSHVCLRLSAQCSAVSVVVNNLTRTRVRFSSSVPRVLGDVFFPLCLLLLFTFRFSCSSSSAGFCSPTRLPVVAFLDACSFSHWVLTCSKVLTHPLGFFLFYYLFVLVLLSACICIFLAFLLFLLVLVLLY